MPRIGCAASLIRKLDALIMTDASEGVNGLRMRNPYGKALISESESALTPVAERGKPLDHGLEAHATWHGLPAHHWIPPKTVTPRSHTMLDGQSAAAGREGRGRGQA